MRIDPRLEEYRLRTGPYASPPGEPLVGAFDLPGPCGARLHILAASALADPALSHGWDHVSVSTVRRPPNWQEMCWVKDRFWKENDWVVQFHPARSQYVNLHPHCLHLWHWTLGTFPMPPAELVGPPDPPEERQRRLNERQRRYFATGR